MIIASRIVRRRAHALLVGLVLLVLSVGAAAAQTVRLTIDYGNGATKQFADLPWSQGATVLGAMNAAKARPPGLAFAYSGSGTYAFLTTIDGLANEGTGAGRKNWQFLVNGTYANRGFAVYQLKPEDEITWRFAIAAPTQ